jgi:hypothetical protein
MRIIQPLINLISQINWLGKFYYRYIYALGLDLGWYFYYTQRWWAGEVVKKK